MSKTAGKDLLERRWDVGELTVLEKLIMEAIALGLGQDMPEHWIPAKDARAILRHARQLLVELHPRALAALLLEVHAAKAVRYHGAHPDYWAAVKTVFDAEPRRGGEYGLKLKFEKERLAKYKELMEAAKASR